jgi:hypothetical protein
MKMEVTRKYMKSLWGNDLFSVGYCGAYHLLYGIEPVAYNAGVYGWNCDYYYTCGVCICTGYRPHGRSTIGKTAEYEKQAKEIVHDWDIPYEDKLEKIAEIRAEWIDKLLED